MQDLYQALGVERSASQDEIKKAYRSLTRQYHPDKNPGDKSAEERFKTVSQAYDVLGDGDKRKLYDEFGEMSLTQGFDPDRARAYQRARSGGFGGGYPGGGFPGGGFPGGFSSYGDARETSFDELLSRLFGGGRVDADMFGRGGSPGPQARRGQDVKGEIAVSLLDSLLGVTVPLRVDARGGESKTLDVRVPEGISDGGKLRVRGKGGPGSPPGDIILTVHVRKAKRLERDGTNLRMRLPVTALEAYRGGPIDVPTPWGSVTMKLPPGVQNGQTLRLRGKGVRIKGEARGDMLVSLDLQMPAGGDEELLAVLERLQGEVELRREDALS